MMVRPSMLCGPFLMLEISASTSFGADKPVDDVGYLWNLHGDDPDRCGCIVIDKQWIDEDKNPIELTLNAALYGVGTQTDQFGLADTPQFIQPGIELFVTVTVHDLAGNVYTDSLLSASVVPINNFEDTTLHLVWTTSASPIALWMMVQHYS